ncbi:uncharacterized protein [Littorina saxatilis]|uniref:uncharacterized protein isoform X2 n=1 Tax=Littorina saxatilis TaxID=31220 RepID=UPI0038B63AA7
MRQEILLNETYGGNMFCIKIWNKSSAPYLQALHFSFAVGAFLAPLLARPFLVGQGALGPNSTVFSASHYPVNVGSQNNDRHARSAEALWWTERWNDRVVREVGNETGDGVTQSPEVAGSGMNATTSGLNSTDAVSALETTTVPRRSKPSASDGKLLNKHYADGKKANKILTQLKNNVPQPDEGGDGSKMETTTEASLNQNGTTTAMGNVSLSNNSSAEDTGNSSSSAVDDEGDKGNGSSVSENGVSADSLTSSSPSTTSTTTTTTTTTTPTTTTTTTPKPTTTLPTTTTTVSTTTVKQAVSTNQPEIPPSSTTNSSSSNITITTTTLPPTTTPRKSKPEILDVITSTINAMKHMSKIQFAYMIIGLVLLGNAAFFLVLYWKDCRAGTLLHQVTALGPSPPLTSSCFRVSLLSLLFVFFLFYVGVEVTFGGLITTFAVESDLTLWSRPQGATLAALFWGSIAVGRGLGIFIARCFKPPCMLVTDLVFMVSGAVILAVGLKATPVMLWVGTVTLGFGMSSIFPTAVSWADCYYPLTGRAAAVFITGSGFGEMVIPVVTGYLFERFDSMWLMYMVLCLSVLVTVVFISLQCIASRQPAPTSVSKLGFMPLQNDDEENSFAMNSLDAEDMPNGNTGYTESMRRRQLMNGRVEDAEEETTKLVDLSD